jgi:dsRNA-specific ribonuclease
MQLRRAMQLLTKNLFRISFSSKIILPQVTCCSKYAKLIRGATDIERAPSTPQETQNQENNDEIHSSVEKASNYTFDIPRSRRRDSNSIRNLTSITTARDRGKNVSLSGRVYNENELTKGLVELIYRIPLLQPIIENPEENFDSASGTNGAIKLFTCAATHKSFGTGKVGDNEAMSFMGKYVLDMWASQLCADKYFGKVGGVENVHNLNLCKSIYTNRTFLGDIVALKYWELNPNETLRCYGWNEMQKDTQKDILADFVLILITVVYQLRGPSLANQLIEQELFKDTPSNIFRQLLELKRHRFTFEDIIEAQFGISPRVIEERSGNQNFRCSYFRGIDLIGYATADAPSKARNLAALNGLASMAAKLPQY